MDYKTRNKALQTLSDILKEEFSLTICLGVEIEFYMHTTSSLSDIQQEFDFIVTKEKGQNQFEINLPPSQDVVQYAEYINSVKRNLANYIEKLGGKIDFRGKPYKNDFGSAMHVHINFLEEENYDKYAIILCNYIQHDLESFIPNKEDYARLDHKFMAPTHISYGGNNRTTAIRIPDLKPKRIEHRVASANADPYLVFYSIIRAIILGLKNPNHIKHIPKIYGNAFDPQYNLQRILNNINC